MSEPILPWPQVPRMAGGCDDYYDWHHAINNHSTATKFSGDMRFMYSAKNAAEQVAGIAETFKREREGRLRKVHHQCSHDVEGRKVPDNHTTCCLGVICRECPHLKALREHPEGTPEQRDWWMAWTCVGHILSKGGDMAGEGFIQTVDDRMYWDTVYEHLASAEPEELNP